MVIDLEEVETIIFPIDVMQLVVKSISDNETKILDLNRRQLFAGNDANGNEIIPFYTDFTIEKKIEKGQPIDRVTLLDTGDFYNSIFLNPFGNEFEFDARDIKTSDLKEKYGNDILGIANDDLDDAAELIKDSLIEYYGNELRK